MRNPFAAPRTEPKTTRWTNPTNQVLRVRLCIGGHHDRRTQTMTGTEYLVVTWEPGETHEIPTAFDNSIQRVRSGVIVSGSAPQLVRADGPRYPIAPALIPPDPRENKPSMRRGGRV